MRLFPDGVAFINYKARKEWAIVETKLDTIATESLEAKLAQLGAIPALAYLKQVHVRYGQVVGATQPNAATSPQVGEKLDALRDSMRQYVAAVTGSVRRKVPATQTLARDPLAERGWDARLS